MKSVFVIADNITTPLGSTTGENFNKISQGISAIKKHNDQDKSEQSFYASLFDDEKGISHLPQDAHSLTRFEQLLAISINDALQQVTIDPAGKATGFILSSTKGNVSLLEDNILSDSLKHKISLPYSAKKIADYFKIATQPIIVSQACISGVAAIIMGKRLLQSGIFENIIIAGADMITRFILSGFQSFHAISDEPCKPFDAHRTGLTLGEAAATLILSVHKPESGFAIEIAGGSISNDANHISGPSRTGEELSMAIHTAMAEARTEPDDIGFISAHGTATLYNDDMESKAFHLAGLPDTPVNSLKGYFGHTLGAAGLLETVISIQSLKEKKLIPTKGFNVPGTEKKLNVYSDLQLTNATTFLKTASGFGGCNAAIVVRLCE